MTGYVYVIQAAGTNRYKVGMTKRNVAERLNELQTGSPIQLAIVNCSAFEDCKTIEAALHEKLKEYRVPGLKEEWFEVEDVNVILRELRFCEMIEANRKRQDKQWYMMTDVLRWCAYDSLGAQVDNQTGKYIFDDSMPTFMQFLSTMTPEIERDFLYGMIGNLFIMNQDLNKRLSYLSERVHKLDLDVQAASAIGWETIPWPEDTITE